jgi:hypothetical protein
MGTGARRGAGFEVIEQGTLFVWVEHLPRLDRQSLANAPGYFCFQFVLQRSFVFFEILHQGA